jgi:hypothetical protein
MFNVNDKEIIREYCEKVPELLGQPRVSFLIGAGCSACAGLPFMSGLTNQICDLLSPEKALTDDERTAYRLLQEIRAKFDGLKNVSIEDFLSEIQDIDAILQRQLSKGVESPVYSTSSEKYSVIHTQLLLKDIKKEIRNILGGNIATIKYHRKFCKAIHYDLAKGRRRTKHPVNYFILNYDTLFEDALALEGIIFSDGFIGGATAWWDHSHFGGEEYSLGENRALEARVYKLHGSIDWIKPEKSEFPIRLRQTLPGQEIIGKGEPVVIYPSSMKYKETQYDPFAQMMMSFRKCLTVTENHVLAIMGYGFNDEHINIEVYNAIHNSNGALSVVIFYGGDELPDSLKSWLLEDGINSRILILGKKGIWKDGKQILTASKDIGWYKFENICLLASGEIE